MARDNAKSSSPAFCLFGYAMSFAMAAAVKVALHMTRPPKEPTEQERNGDEPTIEDSVDADVLYEHAVRLEEGLEGMEKNAAKAVYFYERAIANGPHKDARYRLACMLNEGRPGLPPDVKRAIKLYDRCMAEDQSVRAMHELGLLYRYGADGVPKDAKKALALFERALATDPQDVTRVALAVLMTEGADGVPKDVMRAKQLYEEAVKNGYSSAMYNLALLLRSGDVGVPRNIKRAIELYQQAIDTDAHVHAMYNLANLYFYGTDGLAKQPAEAVKLATRAVDEDPDADNLYLLATYYEIGADPGVPRDVEKAAGLYDQAIEKGSVEAMFRRVVIARSGQLKGDDADGELVFNLLRRADAEGPHLESTYLLGTLTLKGKTYPSHAVNAKALFEKAAAKGHAGAMYELALLLEKGADGVKRNVSRAKQLYQKLWKEDEHSGAMNRLGVMYRDGADGIAANAKTAYDWFAKAIKDDANVDAIVNMAELYLVGSGEVKPDLGQATSLYAFAYDRLGSVPAMSRWAVVSWKALYGVPRDVKKAIDLASKAVEKESRLFDMMFLSRMLASEESGEFRDQAKADEILEECFRLRARRPPIAAE